MAERHDGGGAGGGGGKGGKILSMTVKRAQRVQEKMMQKLGKSDQTRDEVFEEFVNNFHKQNASAIKLQKELMKYMNSIRVLYQNTKSMSDTLKELYEEDWDGCEKQRELMEQRILLWEDLLTSLTSRTVEPMTNYISRFSDVKTRIQKRERKMVDYDLRRRELEHAKSKAKVNDQKVQQAEDTHTQAKQLYDEITDELYEELPTLYDSRIQFYGQIFQSIAAAETRFHAEISKVDEDLARVMDGLASEAATGVHSTKKQRNALSNAPKLLSRPEEESEEDSEGGTESQPTSRSPSLKQSHLSPSPPEPNQNNIDQDTSTSSDVAVDPAPGGQPKKPPPFRSPDHSETAETGTGEAEEKGDTEDQQELQENQDTAVESPPANEELLTDEDREQNVASPLKTPPPKPAAPRISSSF
uniref:Putative aggregation factor n=1 Tax=Geodia cydonium TaxID=6047 RepID=Q8WQ54_GEOCY|nr:putative aggregation factor [Geodia cydonium]